jgi:hypothetical protein
LCINQEDVEERNCQVRMMGDIYRKAQHVAAYLGEQTEETPQGIELLGLLYGASQDPNLSREQVETHFFVGYWRGTDPNIPVHHSPRWDVFQDFFRREYFSRIWVIQEVALASSDPWVLLGDREIRWKRVGLAAAFYHQSGLYLARPKRDQSNHVLMMDEYRNTAHDRKSQRWSLLQLLRRTRKFRSTDPRDKIFALHGLASDICDDNGTPLFEVDYRVAVQVLYRTLAARIIVDRRNLNILSYAGKSAQSIPDLPSWVPDWSFYSGDTLGTGADDTEFHFKTSSNIHGKVSCSPDYRILDVSGLFIDTIEWVSETLNHEKFNLLPEFREAGAFVSLWKERASCLGEQYVAGGTVTEAFWRTLIADMGTNREQATEDFYIHFLNYWRLARLSDMRTEEYMQAHPVRPSITDDDARREAQAKEDEYSFLNEDQIASGRRRFEAFLAEEGIVCTKDESCHHCKSMNDPKIMRTWFRESVNLRTDDPTLDMMDDQFIAEWFRRLRSDEAKPIHVLESGANSYAVCILHGATGRCFFITSGKLMGLAPPKAKPGDKIAIIAGAQVPFVLRPRFGLQSSTSFNTLVGEAYVHGVMDGSFVKVNDEGIPEWNIIRLI